MISIIIQREYLERVRKKSFIITTILMPILMLALMVIPAAIAIFSEGSQRTILVVDQSGVIAQRLTDDEANHFITYPLPLDSALASDRGDAVLEIPADIIDNNEKVTLYSNSSSSLNLESNITSQINNIVRDIRLESYNIPDIDHILESADSNVSIRSMRIDGENEQRETSTFLSYMLGMVLMFILYMCLLLYGQMVMTSIIEEKSNRVLELMVSSVKPMNLMLGKICGICLVAVTQIIIWAVLMGVMSAFVLPALLPAEMQADMASLSAGAASADISSDVEMLQVISVLSNVGYIMQLFGLLLLFLVGGFMLFAALFAAIGSAVDNIQDASQLQSIVMIPIILGMVFSMTAVADPNSSLAVWTSIIPFTSPMVMMARIPFGIPGWEIILSLVLLYASFFVMVWIAAKIYRVGIFMYGKKPDFKELMRWVRYK